MLALADLPVEAVPVVAAATVIAGIAFVAHPSVWRTKFRSVAPRSRPLFAMVAVAAVPFVVYATGQLDIRTSSGPHDEHYEFGHRVVMALYALLIPLFGAVAASKVSGWPFPLWAAGLMSVALGIGSLGIGAVSQLSTVWSLLAIGWGAAFIAVGDARGGCMPQRSELPRLRRLECGGGAGQVGEARARSSRSAAARPPEPE